MPTPEATIRHARAEPTRRFSPAMLGAFLLCAFFSLAIGAAAADDSPRPDDPIGRGDAAWLSRAEGRIGLRADASFIERAVAAYGDAWRDGEGSLEAGWKLLRALWFAGEFAAANKDAARARYDEARAVSRRAFKVSSERFARDGAEIDDIEPGAFPASFSRDAYEDVARVMFWSAINWGAWSGTHGLLATVREGVANRLNRYALASIALDPSVDRGGAQRLLATLHAQLPRVPFLTGWVTRSDAVGWAERALQIEPDHPGSKYVLALTLLETGPEGRRGEAIALMEQAAAAEPRAGMILEDLATRESAREHLSKLDL